MTDSVKLRADEGKGRSEEVRMKMQPDMKVRVERIAKMHGMPAATWCHHMVAAAVVEFERKMQLQNKAAEQLNQSLMAALVPKIEEMIQDSEVIAGCTDVPKPEGE